MTVQDALDRIWSDEALRKRLLADPKPILKEFGLQLPDSVSVQIHENTPTLMNVVLPRKPEGGLSGGDDPVSKTIERAWTDPTFKSRLLADPKEAAAEMGVRVPETVSVKVWENTETVEHMILPMNPAVAELSDSDLEAVAGGGLSKATQTGLGCMGGSAVGFGVGTALAFTAVGAAVGTGISIASGVASGAGKIGASAKGKC